MGEFEKVHFKYQRASDYRAIHSDGASGAVTPAGDVRFDLYMEYLTPPPEQTHRLRENGKLSDRIHEDESEILEVTREHQVGVVLSARTAENIARWLLQKAEEAKEREKARPTEGNGEE